MKPFAKGDIFLGCTYLNDEVDDHKGDGRILQYDKELNQKGVLWTKGTEHLVIGLTFDPNGTLWGFDMHNHVVIRVSPMGLSCPIIILQIVHFQTLLLIVRGIFILAKAWLAILPILGVI